MEEESALPNAKVILIGDHAVGKTRLYSCIAGVEFTEGSTLGGNFAKVSLRSSSGRRLDIRMWDTAGQEKYQALIPNFISDADFILAVFAVCHRGSFEHLQRWLDLASEKAPATAQVVIVGNKCDLMQETQVQVEEAEAFTESAGASEFFLTSALTSQGVEDLKLFLAKRIVEALPGRKVPVVQPLEQVRAVEPETPDAEGTGGCC
jgi:small GTP-binding protein